MNRVSAYIPHFNLRTNPPDPQYCSPLDAPRPSDDLTCQPPSCLPFEASGTCAMSTVKLGQPRGNRSHATTTVTPAGKALKPSTRTPKTLKPPKSALKAAEKARARALADAELDRERQLSTTRLKTCWELIFEKYGKDMEDVADVVDPWTGDIIVDNGHIRGLQNECDLPENEDVFPWSELLGPEDTDERIKKRKRDSLDDGTKQVRATKTQRVPLPKECFGGCKYGILATCSVCGSDELERVPLSQIMDEPLPEPSESERIPLMQITEGPWDEKNNTLPSPPRRRDILQPASPALAKLPSDDFVLGRLGATQGSAVLKALALQISLSRENPPAPPETTVVAAHEPNALISTPSSPEKFAATTIQDRKSVV